MLMFVMKNIANNTVHIVLELPTFAFNGIEFKVSL